ncbi:unnamed protein product [Rhodiola kirilowii]
MATAEVAASLLPENEQTDELSGGTATGGIPATTETKEVVEVGDDDEEEEEEDYVAPEEPGPEDSSAEKDLEDGTGDDEDEE